MKIRRLQKEDLQTRVDWMNNPRVYSSMHFGIPVVMENTVRWFENNQGNDRRADVAFTNDNGELVAFGGITGINPELKMGELYVFVCPTTQAKGLGTEATRLLCEYGFAELGLNKIYLETNDDNYAAQRVYEKVGFVLEGKKRQEYIRKDGTLGERYYYGLLKGELK